MGTKTIRVFCWWRFCLLLCLSTAFLSPCLVSLSVLPLGFSLFAFFGEVTVLFCLWLFLLICKGNCGCWHTLGVFPLECCFAVAVLGVGHRIALFELGSTLHRRPHRSSSLFFIALSVTSGLGHGYNTWSVGNRHRPVEGSTCQLGLFNNRIVGGVAFLAW